MNATKRQARRCSACRKSSKQKSRSNSLIRILNAAREQLITPTQKNLRDSEDDAAAKNNNKRFRAHDRDEGNNATEVFSIKTEFKEMRYELKQEFTNFKSSIDELIKSLNNNIAELNKKLVT